MDLCSVTSVQVTGTTLVLSLCCGTLTLRSTSGCITKVNQRDSMYKNEMGSPCRCLCE